jgi:hypothetical protein
MTSRPMLAWYEANHIDWQHVPDDAQVTVDEQAATLTVEHFYRPGGQLGFAGRMVMRHEVTVPLLQPPPPGLLEAYRHTLRLNRRDRLVMEAVRRLIDRHVEDRAGLRAVRTLIAALAATRGEGMVGRHGLLRVVCGVHGVDPQRWPDTDEGAEAAGRWLHEHAQVCAGTTGVEFEPTPQSP